MRFNRLGEWSFLNPREWVRLQMSGLIGGLLLGIVFAIVFSYCFPPVVREDVNGRLAGGKCGCRGRGGKCDANHRRRVVRV